MDKKSMLLEAGLKDDVAWDIVEGMTTEVGQRQGVTKAEARARIWSVATLKSLGFANDRMEEVLMPTWVQGDETSDVNAPFLHKLHISALGNNGSTGADGLEAEVVYFRTPDALRAAPDGSLNGKNFLRQPHDDTLDKIDKTEMRQNVATWAVMQDLHADNESELKPEPKS